MFFFLAEEHDFLDMLDISRKNDSFYSWTNPLPVNTTVRALIEQMFKVFMTQLIAFILHCLLVKLFVQVQR